ncbi:MAG: hypothetical protein WBB45_21285 [Cyclobacteriaceae bacterium]
MPIAKDVLRVGKHYGIRNYSEEHRFEVLEIQANGDIVAKDLDTLESFSLNEVMQYGRADNYDMWEIRRA